MTEKQLFEEQVNKVIEFEGGFSDHKSDLGGTTMYGISSRHNPEYADLIRSRKLTIDQAKSIYYEKYFLPSRSYDCYKLGFKRIGFILFDCRVHGSTITIKELQAILAYMTGRKLYIDGKFGASTYAALEAVSRSCRDDSDRVLKEEFICAILKDTSLYCARIVADVVMQKQAKLGKPVYDYTKGFYNRMIKRLDYV